MLSGHNDAMPYRLFIAAELPAHIKEKLAATQDALRAERSPVRWVAPAAMHLTLCFLGEADEALVESIAAAMDSALAGRAAPELRLAPAGMFPGVVWMGVAGESAALAQIQGALAAALEPLGFAPERRAYKPHLTLGRVRRDAERPAVARLAERIRALPAPAPSRWHAEHVTLFRSELLPPGPIYHALHTIVVPRAH